MSKKMNERWFFCIVTLIYLKNISSMFLKLTLSVLESELYCKVLNNF